MRNSSWNRVSHLATFGNTGLYPAGQRVFSSGPKGQLLVPAGVPVLFNPKTGMSLAAADVASEQHVSFAVSVGAPGSLGNRLVYLGGERLDLCTAQTSARVRSPKCGKPQVVDIFFDKTKCGKAYSLQVDLDDSFIRSAYDFNGTAKYFFPVDNPCTNCDDCNTSEACDNVACALVDQINGRYNNDPSMVTRFFFKNNVKQYTYQPFRAARLFNQPDSIKRWCLEREPGGCGNCALVHNIKGIKIDDEEHIFADLVGVEGTSEAYLQLVIEKIRAILDADHGYAGLSTSVGKCCPFCLEISSCATEIALLVPGDAEGYDEVLPSETESPFAPKELDTVCRGCSVEPSTVTMTCGIRFYIDPVTADCLCDLPPNEIPRNYWGRTINVYPIGDGWAKCDGFFSRETQRQVLPTGFGYYYQHQARFDSIGGAGKHQHRLSNRRVGRLIGLPDKFSRDSNVHVNCKEAYCVYSVESVSTTRSFLQNALHYSTPSMTNILVPSSDTVTRLAVEGVVNALMARGLCSPGTVECITQSAEGQGEDPGDPGDLGGGN